MPLLPLRNRLLCAIGALALHQACSTADSPSAPPGGSLAGAGGASAGTSALAGSAPSGAGAAQGGAGLASGACPGASCSAAGDTGEASRGGGGGETGEVSGKSGHGGTGSTTGGAGTQGSNGKGGQTVKEGIGGAGAKAGTSSGASGQSGGDGLAGDGGTAGAGATAGSGEAGCGGTSSGQKECPPPVATEMPEPSDQWTPECERVLFSPMAPISNCCIDVACYMPAPSEPCKSHQQALSNGLIYLPQAYGSGFCDCSNKGANGLEGPFFVPDGYPAHPVVKPGLCCYTSNYSECFGRPLRIESRERIARLQRDVFWG